METDSLVISLGEAAFFEAEERLFEEVGIKVEEARIVWARSTVVDELAKEKVARVVNSLALHLAVVVEGLE